MTSRDWLVGSASAVLGGLLVAGAMQAFRGEGDRTGPSSSEPAPASEEAALDGLRRREADLDRREAALAVREAARASAAPTAVPVALEAKVEEVALPAAAKPAEEDPVRKQVLEASRKLGTLLGKLEGAMAGEGEGEEAASDLDQMQLAADLMGQMALLKKHEADLVGDLGADSMSETFDGMMPEPLRATPDQRQRFREIYKDAETRMRMAGLPPGGLSLTGGMTGGGALTPEQAAQRNEIHTGMMQSAQGLLTPAQQEHFNKLGGPGGGGAIRVQVGAP